MERIVISNSNVIINAEKIKHDRHWKTMLKVGKWRLYLTYNYRMKNAQERDQKRGGQNPVIKRKLYAKTDGHCMMCGKKVEYRESQMHHVLPYWLFRELAEDERNAQLLCRTCHSNCHRNPFLNARLQEEKARELGIDLKEYYGV